MGDRTYTPKEVADMIFETELYAKTLHLNLEDEVVKVFRKSYETTVPEDIRQIVEAKKKKIGEEFKRLFPTSSDLERKSKE